MKTPLRDRAYLSAVRMQGVNPLREILGMMTPDAEAIGPESPGAKRWVWLDHGEVRLSGRILARLGTPLVLLFLAGFAAALAWAFRQEPPVLWQQAAMGLSGLVLAPSAALAAYNRVVRRCRRAPGGPGSPA